MPEVVGQYTLTTVLGGGGMATVYRGEHISGIGMLAAVKKLHAHLAIDARIRQRLRIEAQALVRLQHPNIVRIIDFVETGDTCALVTELVEGRTLRAVMEEVGRPMPITQALLLMRQILLGVGHAHKQQCLHRDIKPGNIMVTPDNQVKVLDFGIASLLDRDRMTGTGISLGTPVYMAPEQVEGTEGLDERVDIYALGVTFWEMLAGPNARPIGAQGWRLRTDHVERLRHLRVPDAVVDVIAAMVEEDKDRRLRTCPEVVQALAWAMEEASGPHAAASSVEETIDEDDRSDERTIPMERSGMANLAALPTGPVRAPTSLSAHSQADTLRDGQRTPPLPPGAPGLEGHQTQPWQGPSVTAQAPRDLSGHGSAPPLGAAAGVASERSVAGAQAWGDVPGPLRAEEISRHGPRQGREAVPDPQTLHEGTKTTVRPKKGKKKKGADRGPVIFAAVVVLIGVALASWVLRPKGGRPIGVRGDEVIDTTLKALPGVVFFQARPFAYAADHETVWLSSFAMQQREVTVGEYRRCMDAPDSPCPDALARYARSAGRSADAPPPLEGQAIEYVSWDEAQRYCRWAFRERELPRGYASRLPTDAEWEHAARGFDGLGRTYPTGSVLPADLGNTAASTRIPLAGGTARDRTDEGVMDLTGSVEEWVLDGREGEPVEGRLDAVEVNDDRSDPIASLATSNPSSERALRAVRGGNYRRHPVVQAPLFVATGRQWVRPTQVSPGRGFRCVVGREHQP